ncbi:unnamed protein product [Rotaria magnacalcarata]
MINQNSKFVVLERFFNHRALVVEEKVIYNLVFVSHRLTCALVKYQTSLSFNFNFIELFYQKVNQQC